MTLPTPPAPATIRQRPQNHGELAAILQVSPKRREGVPASPSGTAMDEGEGIGPRAFRNSTSF